MDNKLPTTMTFVRQLSRDMRDVQWHIEECPVVRRRSFDRYTKHVTDDLGTFPIGGASRVHDVCLHRAITKAKKLEIEEKTLRDTPEV